MAVVGLDPTYPANTDLLSQGDDAIRQTRQAIKLLVDQEHTLDGFHQFPSGTTVEQPLPDAGRLYINTQLGRVQFGTGTGGGGGWKSAGRSASFPLNETFQFTVQGGSMPRTVVVSVSWPPKALGEGSSQITITTEPAYVHGTIIRGQLSHTYGGCFQTFTNVTKVSLSCETPMTGVVLVL